MKPRQPLRRLRRIVRLLPLAGLAATVVLAVGCGAGNEPAAEAGGRAATEGAASDSGALDSGALDSTASDSATPAGGAPESGAPDSAAPAIGLTLDAEDRRRLGIVTAPLAAAEYEARVEGTGVVLAAQAVIERMAALDTAGAAMRKSRAALERARNLFKADTAVSREALEAAESQAAADDAQLELARTQAAAAFGNGAPWLAAERRTSIIEALSTGRAVVVRASFPGGLPSGVPPRVLLRRVGAPGGSSWTSTEVWLGPADPSVPGPVLLAYVEEDAPALISGERVVASVGTGETREGVVVPSSAVVIAGGAAWCYVQEGEDHFVRERIDLDRPLGDGYFQAADVDGEVSAAPSRASGAANRASPGGDVRAADARLVPGRRVVVSGAGLLLGAETAGGEEDD